MGKIIQDEFTHRSDLTPTQKYKKRHPEKWNKIKRNNLSNRWEEWDEKQRAAYHLKKRYKLSFEEYETMYSNQNGSCKICDKKLNLLGKDYDRAVVDHDHSNNKVRGLLCNPCNKTLGIIKDSKETLRKMIEYLENNLNE